MEMTMWLVLQDDVEAWVHSIWLLHISENGAYLCSESARFVVLESANAACNKGSICTALTVSDKSKKHLSWR